MKPIVFDYETGSVLDFPPSQRLCDESDAAVSSSSGVVSAYLSADGTWHYAPDSQVSTLELCGHKCKAVWVEW